MQLAEGEGGLQQLSTHSPTNTLRKTHNKILRNWRGTKTKHRSGKNSKIFLTHTEWVHKKNKNYMHAHIFKARYIMIMYVCPCMSVSLMHDPRHMYSLCMRRETGGHTSCSVGPNTQPIQRPTPGSPSPNMKSSTAQTSAAVQWMEHQQSWSWGSGWDPVFLIHQTLYHPIVPSLPLYGHPHLHYNNWNIILLQVLQVPAISPFNVFTITG